MAQLTQLGQWKGAQYGDHVAFAPDGRVWAAGRDGSVALFHDARVDRLLSPPAHAADVRFSADGKLLYTGPFTYDLGAEKFVDSGDLAAAMLFQLPGIAKDSYALERGLVTPDGQEVVLATRFVPSRRAGAAPQPKAPGGRLLLAQARTFAVTTVLKEQGDWSALAASARHLAGVSGGAIFVFDRQTHQPLAELKKQLGMIRIAFSPDGKYLASVSAGRDHSIVLWDTATWKESASWSGDDQGVEAIAFHPTQPLLLSGGYDHHLKLWSLPDGKLVQSLAATSRIRALALSPAGDRVATAEILPDQLTLYEIK